MFDELQTKLISMQPKELKIEDLETENKF